MLFVIFIFQISFHWFMLIDGRHVNQDIIRDTFIMQCKQSIMNIFICIYLQKNFSRMSKHENGISLKCSQPIFSNAGVALRIGS